MPATIYRVKDKTRVPGASTIAKLISDPEPLLAWANREGLEGRDFRESRQKAADAGTLAHRMVQASFEKQNELALLDGQPDEIAKPALVAFNAYEEWAASSKLEIVASEVSLVSEEHRYGGTLDAIAYCNGRLSLGDWKTGAIYPEALLQTAGYRNLWDEHNEQKIESVFLCRFAKESGVFVHYNLTLDVMDRAFGYFLAARKLYAGRADMRKVLG